MDTIIYIVTFIVICVAFFLIRRNFYDLKRRDEGTPEMEELAEIIRDGANTFMGREYRVIIPTILFFGVLY